MLRCQNKDRKSNEELWAEYALPFSLYWLFNMKEIVNFNDVSIFSPNLVKKIPLLNLKHFLRKLKYFDFFFVFKARIEV
ncbi:unnamed protein product [Blepharisma stoltei]|uniref:Uncharacterized protein n=1 Tax=Blepharisma stoltei TaxID=1481888 RepID=A0AAU9KE26_9CILI|nr:unnamed protein product [Blepharisma stoltei]